MPGGQLQASSDVLPASLIRLPGHFWHSDRAIALTGLVCLSARARMSAGERGPRLKVLGGQTVHVVASGAARPSPALQKQKLWLTEPGLDNCLGPQGMQGSRLPPSEKVLAGHCLHDMPPKPAKTGHDSVVGECAVLWRMWLPEASKL